MFHLHPEIIEEDAFFRLDTVSSTRGQVELGVWFSINLRLEFVLLGSDGTRRERFLTLSIPIERRKGPPHPKNARITEIVEEIHQRSGCNPLFPPQELHFFLECEPRWWWWWWLARSSGPPRRIRGTDGGEIIGESDDSVSTKSYERKGCRKPPHKSDGITLEVGSLSSPSRTSRRQAPPSEGY